MSLRKIMLISTMLFMLMLILNTLSSQEAPPEPDDSDDGIIGEDEYEENKTQIENPNTKEEISKALLFFQRADRTENKDSALNDRIEGLTRLQEILTQEEYRADVVYNPIGKIHQGARIYVRNLLAGMSDEVLELYKSRYEKIASDMINNAIFNKDLGILMKGVRTYPFTDSAVTGAIQGSRILIEQNKLADAASLLRDLIHQKNIAEVDRSSLVSQIAFCYRNLLWDYELEQLLEFTRKSLPNARINLGHKFVDLSSYVEDMLKETKTEMMSPSYSESFPKDGGNSENNKIVNAIVNPEELKWAKPLPLTIPGSKHSYSNYDPFGYRYNTNFRNINLVYPAVSKDTVYVPNRNNLTAYDLYSGVVKWSFKNKLDKLGRWISDTDKYLIYTASCDDENVYSPIESHVPIYMIPSYSMYSTPKVILQKRELVCFDKFTGDVRWRVGAKWDDKLPLQDRLSYPMAPVIVDGVAFVVGCTVTSNAHFFLAAFDVNGEKEEGKSTGNAKLLWISKVATGQQETNMFGNPIREPIPLGIAFKNNKVIVCSNVGIVGAFDSSTGERVWAQLYNRIPYITSKSSFPLYRRISWFNRPPIICKDKVFVAPLDSSRVYCYDLNTGKLLWFYRYNPYTSYPSRYIIGVYDNKLFFGGDKYLYAVDIESGKLKNALDLYEESRVRDYRATGKPVIMKNICVIPTRTALIHVDLNEVKVIKVNNSNVYSSSVSDIASMGGNLVCAENTLISVNQSNIAVAYDINKLMGNLVKLEKEFPDDLEIKFKIGVLLVENNKTDEGIAYFKKILDNDNKKLIAKYNHIIVQASRKMYSVYYDRAISRYYGGDYDELNAYIAVAEKYAQTKEEKVSILLLNIKGKVRTKSESVFDQLDRLRDTYPDFIYDFPYGEMQAKVYACLEGALTAENTAKPLKAVDYWQNLILYQPSVKYHGHPIYSYAVDRIDYLIKENSRKVYDKWDKTAEELYNTAIKDNSQETLETVIDGYPNSLICEKAYYELILMYIRNDLIHDAIITIQEFIGKYDKSDKRPELMLRLYDLYKKTDVLFSARSLLIEIGKEFKGQKIQYGSTTIDIDSFVKEQLELKKFKDLLIKKSQPTMFDPPLKLKFHKNLFNDNYSTVIELSGNVPKQFENQIYISIGSGLVHCINSEDAEDLWTVNINDSYVKAFYVNNTLLIVTRGGLCNLDPQNGKINWQQSFNYMVEKVAVGEGTLAIIGYHHSAVDDEKVYTISFCNIDDGRVLSDFQFKRLQLVYDIEFYDKILLILGDNGFSSNPTSIFAFDIDKPENPKYEITLNMRLQNTNLIITADKNIVLLTQGVQILRVYDLETGKNKNINKVLKNTMRGYQRGNKKIFVTGASPNNQKSFYGYDPETFEEKWKIEIKNVFNFLNFEVDDERLHVFYRTKSQKYYAEEYNILDGNRIWQYEITDFTYQGNESLDMIVAQKYVIAIQKINLRSSGTQKFTVKLCIIDKVNGKSLQIIDFDSLDNDRPIPAVFIINNYLLIHSYSYALFGK